MEEKISPAPYPYKKKKAKSKDALHRVDRFKGGKKIKNSLPLSPKKRIWGCFHHILGR
jgi:hypothetical protein